MIIGVTGTDGAGKGAVVDYLVTQKSFTHYSARALISEEIERRKLPITRENTRLAANSLREAHGTGFIVKTYLERAHAEGIKKAVIESIRSLGEVSELKAAGAVLLAVDADPTIRYERITGRGSKLDQVSFEEFQKHEALEMNDPDPNGMQKARVMEMADFTIQNNGTLEDLHKQIESILQKIEVQ